MAEHVVAPSRHQVNGKIGLRFTRGGFGTPFFGSDVQVRVDADGMVVTSGAEQSTHALTNVGALAEILGHRARRACRRLHADNRARPACTTADGRDVGAVPR